MPFSYTLKLIEYSKPNVHLNLRKQKLLCIYGFKLRIWIFISGRRKIPTM